MSDLFGKASVTSAVLRGKGALANPHIEKLSAQFGVASQMFFERQ